VSYGAIRPHRGVPWPTVLTVLTVEAASVTVL
jgi:hypothetical protein